MEKELIERVAERNNYKLDEKDVDMVFDIYNKSDKDDFELAIIEDILSDNFDVEVKEVERVIDIITKFKTPDGKEFDEYHDAVKWVEELKEGDLDRIKDIDKLLESLNSNYKNISLGEYIEAKKHIDNYATVYNNSSFRAYELEKFYDKQRSEIHVVNVNFMAEGLWYTPYVGWVWNEGLY